MSLFCSQLVLLPPSGKSKEYRTNISAAGWHQCAQKQDVTLLTYNNEKIQNLLIPQIIVCASQSILNFWIILACLICLTARSGYVIVTASHASSY